MSPIVSERARPRSLDEAAEVLRRASAGGATVRIGETGDLDPTGLDRILEHEAGDLTCTVEAGVRLSTLAAALRPSGQRLALDPPGDPTVGVCLATALSGPLRHRFGAPRDLVLGVTLVLGDGTIASSGGKVVKNVAGYDLAKLVCGSRGRLALIGRVSLRLHPLPEAEATVVVETGDVATVVAAVLRSQTQPSALDVLHPGRVAILFEGATTAVAAQVDAVRQLVGGEVAEPAVWAESRARQDEARGVLRFAARDLGSTLSPLASAVARPGPGVAYVPQRVGGVPGTVERELLRRIGAALDPAGVLA